MVEIFEFLRFWGSFLIIMFLSSSWGETYEGLLFLVVFGVYFIVIMLGLWIQKNLREKVWFYMS